MTFKDQFKYYMACRGETNLKSSRCVPFGANLTQLKSSLTAVSCWCAINDLVEDVESTDVVVELHCVCPGSQQVKHVGQGGRRPATSLIEEFVESFRGKGQRICTSAVVNAVTLLE